MFVLKLHEVDLDAGITQLGDEIVKTIIRVIDNGDGTVQLVTDEGYGTLRGLAGSDPSRLKADDTFTLRSDTKSGLNKVVYDFKFQRRS